MRGIDMTIRSLSRSIPEFAALPRETQSRLLVSSQLRALARPKSLLIFIALVLPACILGVWLAGREAKWGLVPYVLAAATIGVIWARVVRQEVLIQVRAQLQS